MDRRLGWEGMCYQNLYNVNYKNFNGSFSLAQCFCVIYFIRDAKMISVAMSVAGVPSPGVPRLSLSKESPFLPSLLSSTCTDL